MAFRRRLRIIVPGGALVAVNGKPFDRHVRPGTLRFMTRFISMAVTLVLLDQTHAPCSAHAEAPSCFPERTVLWAVKLNDSKGNVFGGLRAGQSVRVLEDFVGVGENEALIEVEEPIRVRARVPRRYLLAFTRQELEQKGGLERWSAGAPVVLGRPEGGIPRLFLADPHYQPEKSPSLLSPCSTVQGTPRAIAHRDVCHGARVRTEAVTHGERRVFWKTDTLLKAMHGPETVTIPSEEWVFLVERGPRESVIEYRDWARHRLYLGKAATAGMRYVPSSIGRGGDHLCCEGLLLFRPIVDVRNGRDAKIQTEIPIVATNDSLAVLKAGSDVRILREQDNAAFVVYRWPSWEDRDFTLQLHGWVAAAAIRGAARDNAKNLPHDAGEHGVAKDGAAVRR